MILRRSFAVAGLLAAALMTSPVLAQAAATIAAPATDTGLWSVLNPYLAAGATAVVGAAVTWASTQFGRLTGIKIRSEWEEQIRQTALTGLFKGAHELELKVDQSLSPTQRLQLIGKAVGWVMARMPGPLGKLGIGQSVVQAIVIKMLGQTIAANPVLDLGTVDLGATSGAGPEHPAMARAAGPGRG